MKENVNNTKFEKAMSAIDAAVDTAIYCTDYTGQTRRLIDELRAKADRMEACMIEDYGEDWRDEFEYENIVKEVNDKYGVDIESDEFTEFMYGFYAYRYYNEMNEDNSGDEILMKFIDEKEQEGVFSTDEFFKYAIEWNKEHADDDKDEFYYWMRMEYVMNNAELQCEFEETSDYLAWVMIYAINNMPEIMATEEFKKFQAGEDYK